MAENKLRVVIFLVYRYGFKMENKLPSFFMDNHEDLQTSQLVTWLKTGKLPYVWRVTESDDNSTTETVDSNNFMNYWVYVLFVRP